MPLPRNVTVPTALITGSAGVAVGALVTAPVVYVAARDGAPHDPAPRPVATVTAAHTVTASPAPQPSRGGDGDGGPEDGADGPSAARPDGEPMTGWESVEGRDRMWGNASVDGSRRNGALVHDHYCDDDRSTEFNLGRDWSTWTGTVGIDDGAEEADGSVTFEVVGDGERLAQETVGLGEAADLEADVGGVLRLELVSTSHECVKGGAVWADPVLH
ncbi:NPCBM/NEW2 domain-containing protein [Nocardiopsis baichengensis]|uniref:NPCBM/NEW2 domain-containing protein n=1 Tax=Nocardiopsis baichengensis TaxID=280240 RepID=UPI0003485E82|nr:NPCBM/NEW2 domain-containing protein [Nocardiopsis baichengensis]